MARAGRLRAYRALPAWLLCLLLALLLHGAVLALLQPPPGRPGGARVAQVRLIEPARAELQAERPPVAAPTTPREQEHETSRPPRPPLPATRPERPADSPPAEMSVGPPAEPAAATSDASDTSDSPDFPDSYVPRALLSVTPRALEPVVLGFPAEMTEIGRYVGVLALFIDEAGVVRRVRPEGEPLPPVLEEAARAAFSAARFSPGEIGGRPSRALIRVEVVFDSRPLANLPPPEPAGPGAGR